MYKNESQKSKPQMPNLKSHYALLLLGVGLVSIGLLSDS